MPGNRPCAASDAAFGGSTGISEIANGSLRVVSPNRTRIGRLSVPSTSDPPVVPTRAVCIWRAIPVSENPSWRALISSISKRSRAAPSDSGCAHLGGQVKICDDCARLVAQLPEHRYVRPDEAQFYGSGDGRALNPSLGRQSAPR